MINRFGHLSMPGARGRARFLGDAVDLVLRYNRDAAAISLICQNSRSAYILQENILEIRFPFTHVKGGTMDTTRLVLLGLLRGGARYGYQLGKMLQEERYRDWATVPTASLYRELGHLADEGLIERVGVEAAAGRPARVLYRLTAAGEEELRRLLREAWSEIAPWGSPQDSAVFFLEALPTQEAAELLRQRLQRLEEEADRLHRPAREGQTSPLLEAIWEHARLRCQSEIEWTRALLARLEAGDLAPEPALPAQAAQPAPRPPRRTTEGLGAFTFVLHTHLPYCRLAGRWPHGEEWIHEAAAETYVPLLNALYDLREEGVPYKLTLSLTPVLTEQLADVDIQQHFILYLEDEIEAAELDIPRFGEEGQPHLEYLATFYRDFYTQVRDAFLQRFSGDIIGAFRQLQDEGYVEIITSAATHGYLPLLSRDASIYGQLRAGVESYRRHFGRAPRAIWLPECAYRPAYQDYDNIVRPALEEFLAPLGLTCFFVETHAIEGGRPVGKAAGEVAIGPYGAIQRRYVIPMAAERAPEGTTFSAYYVVGSAKGLTDPPVAVIGRNNRTGQQVWSGEWGYPGDADYREFHKKDHQSGLQYWRVTGPRVDLGDKDYYHPDWAAHKVSQHANHFVGLVEQLLRDYHAQSGRYGLIASNYDTELFGHWWFEGVRWIQEVLRGLARSEVVDLVTASEYISRHPPQEVMAVPESSWGTGGTHWTWDNPDTHWLWEPLHQAERRMEALVASFSPAEGEVRLALNQAGRELLLLQASDWPFLITTGQAKQYAVERFHGHLERFHRLANLLEQGDLTEAARLAVELYEVDKVFPELDYRWFAARQGRAE